MPRTKKQPPEEVALEFALRSLGLRYQYQAVLPMQSRRAFAVDFVLGDHPIIIDIDRSRRPASRQARADRIAHIAREYPHISVVTLKPLDILAQGVIDRVRQRLIDAGVNALAR